MPAIFFDQVKRLINKLMRDYGDIKGILFDLDGTILDSMPSHVNAWRDVFNEAGFSLDTGFFYLNEGNLNWEQIKSGMPNGGAGVNVDFEALTARQRILFNEYYADKISLFPEAKSMIERLSRTNVELALVTSSVRQVIVHDLWNWLDEFFTLILTGDNLKNGKPHPEPYRKAMEELGFSPGDVLVVENAPAGIQSANSAGLTCLAIATTLAPETLGGADAVFPNHRALIKHFESIGILQAAD